MGPITHKDRLTRFGFEYLETFFESYGTVIDVRSSWTFPEFDYLRSTCVGPITHKDRLTRFGFEYLETFFESYGTKIIVTEQKEDQNSQEELVEDMMSLLASFSGKLYGMRSSRKKELAKQAEEIIIHRPQKREPDGKDKEEMMSLLASFSGKLYGMRSSRKKELAKQAEEIIIHRPQKREPDGKDKEENSGEGAFSESSSL